MNQQEVEAWIAQQGGTGKVQYSRSTRDIDNPAADPMTAKQAGVAFNPTAPAKITISEEKWTAVDAEGKPTGAVLHVRRRPDGDFDIVDQANSNPAKNGEQTPESKNAAELQRQREANAALPGPNPQGATEAERRGQDPAYETDKERRDRSDARIKEQGAAAAAADAKANVDADNRRADAAAADAAAARNKPSSNVEHVKGGDGKEYTRVTTVSADGKSVTVQNYGPDGKAIGEIPGDPSKQAGPVARGPAMPEIVVGATSQAITSYQQALMRDPSLTPAQREAYLTQFIQVAQIATNEATALQRQQESNLNASINLATGKQTALQNGMTAAVNFANNFVGKLPADSHLAGQAYGAMMLMNIINMQHSGLEGITMPGAPQKSTPQPASIVSPGNPQAVSAQLDAAKAAGQQAESQRVAAEAQAAGNPQAITNATSATIGAKIGSGAATPSAQPPAAASATPAQTAPPVDPRSIGAPEAPSAAAMNTGQPGDPAYSPQPAPSTYDPNDPNAASEMGQPGDPGYGETYMKPAAPDYGQPGMRVLPQPGTSAVPPAETRDPSVNPSTVDPQSMMPPVPDFAVLGQYQQRQQQPTPDIGQPLAVLKAQIDSTPPWRISPDLEQAYVAAGGDINDVYRVPGRSAA